MLLYLLYWLIAPILWILLFPACLFNTKIRHHWLNERKTWRSVEKKYQEQKNEKIVVLFHAASTGEFEQLKPILKQMDRTRFFIIQSFFSPTVFNIEKNIFFGNRNKILNNESVSISGNTSETNMSINWSIERVD